MDTPSQAVFLSYASEDAAAAQRIAEALRAAGIEVWFDREELRGGDVWDRRIREQIHDCRLFVPVISAQTETREEGYFRREWRLAVERAGDMAEDRAFLVPVVIDGTTERTARVPDSFKHVQWTRLPGGETSAAFVERVRRLLVGEGSSVRAAATAVSPGSTIRTEATRAVSKSRRFKTVAWAIVAVFAMALAYVVVDRLWLSKRGAALTARTTVAGTPMLTAALEKSIAVLPFADLSEKHDQEYFADGMAEEVIDLLANIPGLKVIGRTSSFQFKGKSQDLRAIGNALGVSYVVEGSVRKSGERIRVTAQLINAQDGSHLWSDTYDEQVGDTLKVQDQIASNMARALQVSVGADADRQRARPPFTSVEAYDLYLRGRHAYDRFDKEGFESATAYFQQALELDPTCVPALELLAVVQDDSAGVGYVEPREGFERARQSAQRALRADPKSSLAYATLSEVHLIYDWDWAAAERDAKEALRLKPRGHSANGVLGEVYEALGRWDDAARLFKTALTLDPLFAPWHVRLSNVQFATGHASEAEKELRNSLQISPTLAGGHFGLGVILLAQGKLEAALTEMQQEQPDSGRDNGLAIVYHAMGRRAESDKALATYVREHAKDDADGIADAYAYRDELDTAFAWLERAYSQKDAGLRLIKSDPFFKTLKGDSRYKAFLRKMNLPE